MPSLRTEGLLPLPPLDVLDGVAANQIQEADDTRARDSDPNVNIIIREPGHIEYAATLGLGVHDLARIKVEDMTV